MKIKHFFGDEFYIALFIVVTVQIIMMFQGFDVCDDGFVLTFYQQIFSNPESVEYNFLYWFSGVLGGLWYQINEDGGIIWFRILGVLVNTGTFILSYKLLKKYIHKLFLVLALSMVLFVNDYGFLTFYHNQITSFLTVLMIYFFSKGLFNKRYNLLILVGFIYVLNGLTRMPNFVLIFLFLAIPFNIYIKKLNYSTLFKPLGFSVLGVILGCLFAFSILFFSGQLEVMENALITMMDVGNTDGSAHNFKTVLMAQYHNHYSIMLSFFEFSILLLSAVFILSVFRKNYYLYYFIFVIIGCLLMFWVVRNGIFSIYTLAYIGSIFTVFYKPFNSEVRIVAFMALIMLSTLTLGSGAGIRNSGYMTIWIGFPLFFLVLPVIVEKIENVFQFNKRYLNGKLEKTKVARLLILTISISFLLLKSYKISQESYFDRGSRFHKTHNINDEKAKFIYTTETRAKIVNNVLENLKTFVEPGDYLFAYDHIPMFHFLTSTLPYTYNPWPGIYDHNSFEKKIKKAENEIKELPIVLIQKFETIIDFSKPLPDYMISEKNHTILHGSKSIALMNSFLKRNNYQEVWSDSYFSIYKSVKPTEEVD